VVDHFPIKVSEGGFTPRPYRQGVQLTRPQVRVVTQMLGDATPRFVRVSTRLRERAKRMKSWHGGGAGAAASIQCCGQTGPG
jgi:hypothetical protein